MSRFSFEPAVAAQGDPIDAATYEAVGRVLSSWESVEFELSRLFAALMDQPDNGHMMTFYGTGRIFPDRLNFVKIAAFEHFKRSPRQDREGDFDKLLEDLILASDRRNEVAHGIVYDASQLSDDGPLKDIIKPNATGLPQFMLLPPGYTERRYSPGMIPKYAYSSVQLRELRRKLFSLQLRVRPFRHGLFPDRWQEEHHGP